MAEIMVEELRALWKKLLKAEAKHKTKKAQKLERKIILLELQLHEV
jgi:hypothetical protein